MVRFTVQYYTEWGESLALVLGRKKYPMTWQDGGVWCVDVEDPSTEDLKDYTYVVMKDGLIFRPEWGHHSSRKARVIKDKWIDCPFAGCDFTRGHTAGIFDVPGFRCAGTAVPVFSLRSRGDMGIGEFRDLRPLVDWAVGTGQCVIQLLPINDTTRQGGWDDSYPYSPVSSFALNPMYIHLQDLGIREDKRFREDQKRLNELPEIDYPAVFATKTAYMRQAWQARGTKDTAGAAFRKFCTQNSLWLDEYCRFCAQRDGDTPEYHAWIQYHLDKQLSEVVSYARSHEVYFKGDLPIGVSADSAEATYHPELFNLDCTAGAPPDFFSADGQNWGFPTYNWDRMAENDFAWWKARLRKMSEYFDAFRIDHILGFFRIWEIPVSVSSGMYGHFNPALPYSSDEIKGMGLPLSDKLFLKDLRRKGFWHPRISPVLDGLEEWQKDRFNNLHTDFFYHRHNDFWRRYALRKLPELLGATGMLACGEDLGMIPDCVGEVMAHERILSLEMPMMEKGRPWPRLSVCATSSHDMETLRMQQGEDPSAGACRDILNGCLRSDSMMAIFPIQDWLSMDAELRHPKREEERINEPANPHHHWRFRMHLNVDELLEEKALGLNSQIRSLLAENYRLFCLPK
uniref:4-alpha-glucanotransferase n=1 Tax=uncultured bacterium fosmid pJB92C9 TaxID=1478074 RepID=A0A0H3U8F5_9BACT|nr:putative 4-alpha-glucanotransferase [uncultured bacterium fosmid pJB92C9]